MEGKGKGKEKPGTEDALFATRALVLSFWKNCCSSDLSLSLSFSRSALLTWTLSIANFVEFGVFLFLFSSYSLALWLSPSYLLLLLLLLRSRLSAFLPHFWREDTLNDEARRGEAGLGEGLRLAVRDWELISDLTMMLCVLEVCMCVLYLVSSWSWARKFQGSLFVLSYRRFGRDYLKSPIFIIVIHAGYPGRTTTEIYVGCNYQKESKICKRQIINLVVIILIFKILLT